MIFEEILIENFGQHKRIHKKVDGNLLGLIGANGKGKSTILKALEWALRGSISTEKNLSSCIYHYDNPDENIRADYTSVTLKFRQNGKCGEIYRKFTAKGTSSRKLTWDDEPVLKAAGKVDAKMQEILGADGKAIEAIVCISQGDIHKLLSGTYAERRKLFSRLMLLSHFEKSAGQIAGYKESFLGKIQDLSGLLTDAEVERNEASEREQRISVALDAIPEVTSDLDILTDMYKVAVDIEGSEEDVVRYSSNLDESERNLQQAKTELGGGEDLEKLQNLKEREKILVNSAADRANYRGALSLQSQWYNDHQTFQKEDLELEELKNRSLDAITFDYALEEKKLQEGRRLVQTFAELESANQQVVEVVAYLPKLKQEGEQLAAEEQALRESIDKDTEIAAACTTLIELYKPALSHDSCECPLCNSQTLDISVIRKNYEQEGDKRDAALTRQQADKQMLAIKSTALKDLCDQYAAANQRKKYASDKAAEAYELCKGQVLQEVIDNNAVIEELIRSNRAAADAYTEKAKYHEVIKNRCQMAEKSFLERAAELGHPDVRDFGPLLEALPVYSDGEIQTVRDEINRLQTIGERFQRYTQGVELCKKNLERVRKELDDNRNKMVTWRSGAGLSELTKSHLREFENQGSVAKAVVQQTLNLLRDKYDDPRKREQGAYNEAKSQLERCEDKILKLNRMKEDQKHQQQIAEELQQMKEAMSVDGLSRTYMDYRFQQIAALTQNHLARLEANFSVMADIDEDLAFSFVMNNNDYGTVMPMSKLSGGEKVRLSIAFLLAVQELMIPDVGLLILDEPTTHVDEEGKATLRNLFMKLSQEFQQTESQIIICDHSPILMSACEDLIELK